MIEGISHITFIVENLERMSEIITEGLGGKEVYYSGDKAFSLSPEKFFVLGNVWIAVMKGASLPVRSYNHVAFKVPDSELDAYAGRLKALGVEFREPRPRINGEGRSLYFYDADNHLFELHTGTLEERLRRYGTK